ncbi:MAG: DUF4097 family beta strand repeat-containing protein [Promethearchaeota archaeon]
MSKNKKMDAIRKSSSNLDKILLILTIIISSIFWVFALYAPITNIQGEYQINKDDSSYRNITQIILNYNADRASVDIKFEDNSDFILSSSWKQIGSPSLPYDSIEIYFNEQIINNSILEINITDSGYGTFTNEYEFYYDFEISIDNSYLINFNAFLSAANLKLSASNTNFNDFYINSYAGNININGISSEFENFTLQSISGIIRMDTSLSNFSNINLTSISGYIDLDMTNNILNDNINITTVSGFVNCKFEDLSFSSERIFNIKSSSGYVDLSWDQAIIMNSPAILYINTISSSIEVDISTLKENIDSDKFILYVDSQSGYADVNLYEEEY